MFEHVRTILVSSIFLDGQLSSNRACLRVGAFVGNSALVSWARASRQPHSQALLLAERLSPVFDLVRSGQVRSLSGSLSAIGGIWIVVGAAVVVGIDARFQIEFREAGSFRKLLCSD
ncbi:hypothetical protein DNK44_11925 [Pseudomonas dryadis]|uniref:Uncharacterized protein n=1 Tax=Phytopseudomonas dryadis TaxID=2487520 RepID=A0A4V2KC97_9GAMM|nr:hypothetical protein DNK44_11925 [Pseudomonas dryadis]